MYVIYAQYFYMHVYVFVTDEAQIYSVVLKNV
jgi:hypothetical protein